MEQPCLQPDDCRISYPIACEGARINFDSTKSLTHEKSITSQGWGITSGTGNDKTILSEGPLHDSEYSGGLRVIKLSASHYNGTQGRVFESVNDRPHRRFHPIYIFLKRPQKHENSMWLTIKNRRMDDQGYSKFWLNTSKPITLKKFSFKMLEVTDLNVFVIAKKDCSNTDEWKRHDINFTLNISLYVVDYISFKLQLKIKKGHMHYAKENTLFSWWGPEEGPDFFLF